MTGIRTSAIGHGRQMKAAIGQDIVKDLKATIGQDITKYLKAALGGEFGIRREFEKAASMNRRRVVGTVHAAA